MTQALVRPAASEVRMMLHKIKLENMMRSRSPPCPVYAVVAVTNGFEGIRIPKGRYSIGTELERPHFPQLVPLALEIDDMGSFTSKSIVIPAADTEDDDVNLNGVDGFEDLSKLCKKQLQGLPEPIKRTWRRRMGGEQQTNGNAIAGEARKKSSVFEDSLADSRRLISENVRVLQWNALSQTLGSENDNFVKCPESALDWKTRRFRMLEEIIQYDADVVCLQEVDHFKFLQKTLGCLNYKGHFLPKPDSPCLYLPDNTGPDGCAIFYKSDKFDLCKVDRRVIEVWRVQSNQVLLSLFLQSKLTGEEIVVATTHLKARSGALLSTLRNEQGKDVLQHLSQEAGSRPVIVTGDFNAEPTEPVYETMINGQEALRFESAYANINHGQEFPYTTWKIREDGEHVETLDYVFYTPGNVRVESVLEFPSGEEIGENRLPSNAYASDHLSLACNFEISASAAAKQHQDQLGKSKH